MSGFPPPPPFSNMSWESFTAFLNLVCLKFYDQEPVENYVTEYILLLFREYLCGSWPTRYVQKCCTIVILPWGFMAHLHWFAAPALVCGRAVSVLAGCLQELAQNKHLQETKIKLHPNTNADQMNWKCRNFWNCVIYNIIYLYIRGVTGGMDQTSGGCSLCYTIPI